MRDKATTHRFEIAKHSTLWLRFRLSSETSTVCYSTNFFNILQQKVTEDDFVRLKTIGKGSFGTVYLVKKKDTGNLYAMKVSWNIIELCHCLPKLDITQANGGGEECSKAYHK